MARPRPARIAVLAIGLLMLGCGETDVPGRKAALSVERLAFELAGGAPQEAVENLVTPIPIPLSDIECVPSNDKVELATVHTREGEMSAIRFAPGAESNIRILHGVQGGAHDAIRLTLAAQGHFLLRALAGRGGRMVSSEIHPQRFPGGAGLGTPEDPLVTRVLELDFTELLDAQEHFTELVLHKPSAEHPVTIVGIDLIDRRGRGRLPAPGAPESVTVGTESRPAVGLTPGLILGLPLTNERLAFDAAVARAGPRAATLRVRVMDARGEERSARPVEITRAWTTVRPALGESVPAGGRLLVEIEGEARALLANPRIERPRPEPPTVLLITSDTHRADHLGTSSPPGFVRTPALDALAAEGVLFTDVFSTTNVTNPSHMALMTGVHPRDTGVVTNLTRLADRARTLAESFSAAGYATFAAVSAQHLSAEYANLRQGFDRVDGPPVSPRDGEVTVATLESWLDDVEGLPVFLWLHLFDVHGPYRVPPELERRYYPADRDPRDPSRSLGLHPDQVPPGVRDDGITDIEYPATQYRAEVDYLDSCLAPLLARPRIARGIVAFTADHGESLGGQDIWWDHEPLYPSTLHVPLILRWPGCPSGRRVDVPVEAVDVGRTLLDLAGLAELPFPGRDLRGALEGTAPARRRFALSSHARTASLEEDGWFLVLHLRSYFSKASQTMHETGETHLFDLSADPDCVEDLLIPELPRATRMRVALLRWLADAAPEDLLDDGSSADAEQARVLEGLGYAGAEEAPRGKWWDPEAKDPDWEHSDWRRLFEDEGYARERYEAARER